MSAERDGPGNVKAQSLHFGPWLGSRRTQEATGLLTPEGCVAIEIHEGTNHV